MSGQREKTRKLLELMEREKRMRRYLKQDSILSHGEFIMLDALAYVITEKNRSKADSFGVNPSELSTMLDATKPAVSKMLNCLEEKGMVERVIDREDRRGVLVSMTVKGIDVYKKVKEDFERMTEKILERMGDKDSEILIYVLQKYFNAVDEVMREEQNKGEK